MANLNEMSKTEMRLEINAAEAVVNNGGTPFAGAVGPRV